MAINRGTDGPNKNLFGGRQEEINLLAKARAD